MEYLSFNLLGMIILFNLGNHGFYANVCQSLKGQPFIIQEEFVSSQTNVRWIKDGNDIVVVSVPTDGSQPNCTIFPTTPPAGYTTYCYNNTNYGLELHKPEDHIGSTFNTVPEGKILKDNNCILEIKDPGTVQCSAYNITINDTSVVELNCGVFNTNIDNVNFTLNYNVLEDTFSVPDSGLNIESGNSLYNITTKYEMSKDSPGFSAMTETTTIKALFIVDYGITIDNSTEITIKYTIDIVPECKECCRCHYNLIVLIITVVLVVVVIIVVIIHLCKIEEKKGVYWALNILLIIEIVVCVSLTIVQIVYLTDESDDSCQITCQDSSKDTCQEEAGCKAATAFVVLGFIAAVLSTVVLILRLIKKGYCQCCHRIHHCCYCCLNAKTEKKDQKKETTDTGMNPVSENRKPGYDRPLPAPNRT